MVLALLLKPQKCPLCKKFSAKGAVCNTCKEKMRFVYQPFCIVCNKDALEGRTHINCYTRFKPEMLITPFYYEGYIRNLILKAKYAKKFKDVKEIVKYVLTFKELFNLHWITNDFVVTSIPADKERYKKRGFNLPEIIAKELAKKLNLKYDGNILFKTKSTPSLTSKRKKERIKDVKGVFAVSKGEIPNKIILVDDIVTTGATLLECSKILKKNRCKEIICFALAYKKINKS